MGEGGLSSALVTVSRKQETLCEIGDHIVEEMQRNARERSKPGEQKD